MAGESPAFHLEERRASHNHSGPKPSSDGSELATATIPSRRRMPTNFSNAEAPDDIGRKADSPVTGGGRGLQNSGRNLGEKYQLAPGRKPPRSSYSDESPRALINSGAATQAHSRQRGRNERRSNLDWVRTTSVKSRDEEGGGSVSPGLGTNDAWSKMAKKVQTRIQRHRSRFIFLHTSPFIQKWNVVTVWLLLFTALVTPYEVAFLTSALPAEPMFWVGRVVDACFAFDVLVNFNLEYLDKRTRMYVRKRRLIAKNYVKGYFIFDLVSIIPFDEIVRATDVLRVTRIIRLVKLLRLMRSSRIFSRMEENMRLSYGAMKLCKFVACAVVVAHWMACLWHLTRELNDAQCDWVAHYWGGGTGMQGDCSEVSASKAERYVAALYLAAMTISTVGYGDVPPQNLAERLYLVFATMIGGGVFAFVTGTVCSTVASMNIRETEFQQSMDACNRFIEEAYLSDELAERLRKYVRYKHATNNLKDWKRTLDELSPALRGEVALELNATQLENVPFFKVCSQEMMIEVSFILVHLTFPPMENIIRVGESPDVMYVIKRGLVACVGKVLRQDSVVGEDMLFRSAPRSYSATTFTYVDTLALRKESLEVILRGFADTAVQLRRHVVKLLFRDQVHIFRRIVERAALFALEQRRRARSEGRIGSFPAWRDVLILFYYIRLAPDEMLQRMEFPLLLTVLETVAPKMHRKIVGGVVRVQRLWRAYMIDARQSQAGVETPRRAFRLMALLGSPGGWRTNSRTWAGEGGGGAGSRLDKLGLSQEGTSRTTRGLLAPASPGQQRGGDRRQSDSEHGGGAQGRGGSLRGPAGLLPSPALLSLDDTGESDRGGEDDGGGDHAARGAVAAAAAAAAAEILHQMQLMQSQMDRMARQLDELHDARAPSRLVRSLTSMNRQGASGLTPAREGMPSAVASAWSMTTSALRAPLEFDKVLAVHESATNRGRQQQLQPLQGEHEQQLSTPNARSQHRSHR